MNKLWYILKEENQFGPFDEQDLQRMFKANKILHNTTLIRRGLKSPIAVSDLVRKSRRSRTRAVANAPPSDGRTNAFYEFPYEKGTGEIKTAPSTPSLRRKIIPNEQASMDQLSLIRKKVKNKKPLLYLLGIFSFIFFSLATVKSIIVSNSFDMERPKNVRPKLFTSYKKKLHDAYKNQEHQWDFLYSKDLKEIYLGSSLPGIQDVKIIFKSIDNKILSKKPVVFKSKITIEKNLAHLKELNFVEGDKIIPGAYEVSIILNKHRLSFWQKMFLEDIKVKEHYQTNILLSFHSKSSYLKELKKFQQLQRRKNNSFVQDIKMKYETLLTIADRISKNLENAKNGSRNAPQVEHMKNFFLQDYQLKYGTFFSNFVIENERRFKDLTNSSDELKTGIVAHYSNLSSMARSLGMISIDAIDSFTTLTTSKEAFSPVLERYQQIMTTCKAKIDKLENIDISY